MSTLSLSTSPVQFPAFADGLAAYINAVKSMPILSEEEENDLATRLCQHNDTEAARRLALSNLRLVVAVAHGYKGYGLDQSDLIQEGNIGLLKAVRKFESGRGARLATFAVYWIRAEIHEFVVRNWRIVKIATTKAQRKLFFNMRRLTKSVTNRRAENLVIAEDLNVKPEEVDGMRMRLRNTEAVVFSTDDEEKPGAELFLTDESVSSNPEKLLEEKCDIRIATSALQSINERERAIIQARRLNEPATTLQSLADTYGISVERVRQIEVAAMGKLTAFVKREASLVT